MLINTNTEFGQRVARRLQEERIIWLTTTDSHGAPQPRPVWFLWDGETVLIFSHSDGAKVRHIQRNPYVALNLDSDGLGGDIIVILGEAKIEPEPLVANDLSAYIEKYRSGFVRIGMNPEGFVESYPIAIRVTPTQLRGH